MSNIDSAALFGFDPSRDLYQAPPTDGWDQWVSENAAKCNTPSSQESKGEAEEGDESGMPQLDFTPSQLQHVQFTDDTPVPRGLFAELTNHVERELGKQRSNNSPTTPPPTSPFQAQGPVFDGESPSAALATMVAEIIVTPEARKVPQPQPLPPQVQTQAQPQPAATAQSSIGYSGRRFAPSASSGVDVSSTIVIEYKNNRRHRIRCPPELEVNINDFVIVELDRAVASWVATDEFAVDAGQVVAKFAASERVNIPRAFGFDVGRVLRVATADDCVVLNETLPKKEAIALQQCHQLIHFLHLPFLVVDAEYSFDQLQVRLLYCLSPQASTSNAPNVSRLQRELAIRLKCKVVLEQQKGSQ